MASIKAVTTAYSYGSPLAFIASIAIAQISWLAAGIFLLSYAFAAMLLKCPRCGLPTYGRVRTDRKGRERRSSSHHSPNPDYCSRCALDFRTHSLTTRFD